MGIVTAVMLLSSEVIASRLCSPLYEIYNPLRMTAWRSYFFLRDCAVGLGFVVPDALSAADRCAFHSAHRFRCASAMRLRADADILRRRRRVTGAWAVGLTPSLERFVPERPLRSSGNVE